MRCSDSAIASCACSAVSSSVPRSFNNLSGMGHIAPALPTLDHTTGSERQQWLLRTARHAARTNRGFLRSESVTYVCSMNRNLCVRNGPTGHGDPGRIRTCDLQLRRLLLYPLSYGAVAPQYYIELAGAALGSTVAAFFSPSHERARRAAQLTPEALVSNRPRAELPPVPCARLFTVIGRHSAG